MISCVLNPSGMAVLRSSLTANAAAVLPALISSHVVSEIDPSTSTWFSMAGFSIAGFSIAGWDGTVFSIAGWMIDGFAAATFSIAGFSIAGFEKAEFSIAGLDTAVLRIGV